MLYAGVDSLQVARGGWLALPLLGVGSATCGGGPAVRLITAIDTVSTPLASLPALPPVRIFEVMQARFYASLGSWWLGARSESAGETIQPLAGPFESAGSPFGYRDSLQQPTLVPGAVEESGCSLSAAGQGGREALPGSIAPAPSFGAEPLAMNRRGFTLPLALLTLVLMGALACGVLLSARLRWLSGSRTVEALQARTLAESEIDRLTAEWDPLRAESLAIGGTVAIPPAGPGPGLAAFDSLLRLGQGLYLVRSTGTQSHRGRIAARAGRGR